MRPERERHTEQNVLYLLRSNSRRALAAGILAAMTMPQAGDPAPDFTLPDQDGNPVSLKDFRGQNVVVYFYPKADTPATK